MQTTKSVPEKLKESEEMVVCPICRNEIKDIPINNFEVLTMCVNTKCSYPFLPDDPLTIKKSNHGNIGEVGSSDLINTEASPDVYKSYSPSTSKTSESQADVFDIQAFLDQQGDVPSIKNTEGMAEIISEILSATNSLTFDDFR